MLKMRSGLLFPRPPNAMCCDNCNPELSQVDTIRITHPYPTRARQGFKPSEELQTAVSSALREWRETATDRYYPSQHIITAEYILDDAVIEKISSRPGVVKDIDIFRHVILWGLGAVRPEFGREVVDLVRDIVRNDPDQVAREEAEREQAGERLLARAARQQRELYSRVFEEVYDAVCSQETGGLMVRIVKGVRTSVPEPKARLFMRLPQARVCIQSSWDIVQCSLLHRHGHRIMK